MSNVWEHKHTREIRVQELSPGDDWEMIVKPTWVDWALCTVALVLFVLVVAWM